MFKFMGKEINAILGAQTILIWTYVDFPLIKGIGMYKNHLTLTVPSTDIICLENSLDPDQLASQKPADQDPGFFQPCLRKHTGVWNPVS